MGLPFPCRMGLALTCRMGVALTCRRSLLEEVTQHKCKPILQAMHVVEGTEPGLSGALSRALQKVVYVTGDHIIREGEPAEAMYFIEYGQVAVFSAAQGEVEIARLGAGSFFGEMALLSDEGRTLATVRVTVSCVTMTLSVSSYKQVCELYPTFRRYVETVARLRLKRLEDDDGGGSKGKRRDSSSLQQMLQNSKGRMVKKTKEGGAGKKKRSCSVWGSTKGLTSRMSSRLSSRGGAPASSGALWGRVKGGLGHRRDAPPTGGAQSDQDAGSKWEKEGEDEGDSDGRGVAATKPKTCSFRPSVGKSALEV